MDPISLAVLTSSLTVLATEVGKGVAGAAGSSLWERMRSMLGWNSDPDAEDLAIRIAKELQANPNLSKEIAALMKESSDAGTAGALIGHLEIKGKNVIVAPGGHFGDVSQG